MRQIAYFSTAAMRQDAHSIASIAAVSFTNNSRDGITGMLVADGNRFLQVIEGESVVAEALVERIRHDRRHVGLCVLVDHTVGTRSFATWSVVYRNEPEFGDFATLGEMIELARAQITGEAARAQVDCFARLFVLSPPPPPPSPWTLAADYGEASALDRRH